MTVSLRDKYLLTLEEVSALTGMSPGTLKEQIAAGRLVARRIPGGGRKLYFTQADVAAFVDSLEVKA